MLVQESLLGEALYTKNMHDFTTNEEADETLSLSDLPLYGSDQSIEEWKDEDLSAEPKGLSDEDLSAESKGLSDISSSEQDYFEFFSQELSPPTTTLPPESFIFCGKIIPHRKPVTSENASTKVTESENKQTKRRSWGMFGWKFTFSRSSKKQDQSKDGEKSMILMHKDDHRQSKRKHNRKQHGKRYDFPLHKVPILPLTSSGKARWYLFLFGISRFSSEMELGDIKSRQSRSPPPSPTLRILNNHNKKVNRVANGGLSGLIRVLSCGRNHLPSTMVATR